MATIGSGALLKGDKELKKFLKDLGVKGDRELRREVRRSATTLKNHYRRDVRQDTDELKDSITADSSNNWLTAEVGSKLIRALYEEFGTRAHVIMPKEAGGVLRFFVDGEAIFAKKVQHPGTRANPALLKAWLGFMSGNMFANRLRKRFDNIV